MNPVYHYCSADTFVNIVKYKKLWLGDIKYMNDFMEKKWFMDVFGDVVSKEMTKEAYKGLHSDTLKNLNKTKPYMCCLSKSGDILSQWRAYAQDGYGVSIGFDPESLSERYGEQLSQDTKIRHSFFLNDVEYLNQQEIRDKINFILQENEEVNNFFAQPDRSFESLDKRMQHQVIALLRNFLHMSIHIKNPAFSEEQEVRLVYNHMPTYHNSETHLIKHYELFIKSKNFRISNGNLTSYYEFPLLNGSVKEIILGPKNIFNEDEVREFLRMHNINDARISRSEATYR